MIWLQNKFFWDLFNKFNICLYDEFTKEDQVFQCTVFPRIVSTETIPFWIWCYVLWPLITVGNCLRVIQLFIRWSHGGHDTGAVTQGPWHGGPDMAAITQWLWHSHLFETDVKLSYILKICHLLPKLWGWKTFQSCCFLGHFLS